MKGRLLQMPAGDARLGDVRGRGAMIAVELVEAGTSEPDAALARNVATACHRGGGVTALADAPLLACGPLAHVGRQLSHSGQALRVRGLHR